MSFDDFYNRYPRKKEPRSARKAYEAALKRGFTHEQIMEGVEILLKGGWDELKYVKYPATWLNGDCFLEPPEAEERPMTTWERDAWQEKWKREKEKDEPRYFKAIDGGRK